MKILAAYLIASPICELEKCLFLFTELWRSLLIGHFAPSLGPEFEKSHSLVLMSNF